MTNLHAKTEVCEGWTDGRTQQTSAKQYTPNSSNRDIITLRNKCFYHDLVPIPPALLPLPVRYNPSMAHFLVTMIASSNPPPFFNIPSNNPPLF